MKRLLFLLALLVAAAPFVSLFAAPTAITAIEELDADVGASWPEPRPILPPGERGLLYPGETISITASGQIDRNHVHYEETETVFLFWSKRKVIDYPQWVQHVDHPLQVRILPSEGNGPPLFGPLTVPPEGLRYTVGGAANAPAILQAFVPNHPVAVDRTKSYGAYRLIARIDSAPRLRLIEQELKRVRMTAAQIEDPKFFNRRLRERYEQELAAAILEQYRTFHKTHANREAAEDVVKLAVQLAPANGTARAELAEFLIAEGRWVEADQQYRRAVADLRTAASDDRAGSWTALGDAQMQLAEVSESKGGGLTPKETLNAEFWYGEAAAAYERDGSLLKAIAAHRQRARVLRVLDRSKAAAEKAERVLERALLLAPKHFTAELLGLSPDGRSMALLSDSASLLAWALEGKAAPGAAIGGLKEAKIVAVDHDKDRMLLTSSGKLHWWSPAKPARLDPAPGSLPRLKRVVTRGGFLLVADPDGQLFHAGPGEVAVPVTLDPGGKKQTAGAIAVNGSGWFAASVDPSLESVNSLSNITSFVSVFDAQRRLKRSFAVAKLDFPPDLPDRDPDAGPPSEEEIDDLASRVTLEFPSFLSLNERGDVLILVSNHLDAAQNRWLFAPAGGEPVALTLPPPPGPAAVPDFDDDSVSKNSWLNEDTVGLGRNRDISPFYSWANGVDVRNEWSHGSFTRDGRRVLLSNLRAGLVEIDPVTGAVARNYGLPALASEAGTARWPLGHLWTKRGTILVAWAQSKGWTFERIWVVEVDPASGQMTESELDAPRRKLFETLGHDERHGEVSMLVADAPRLAQVYNKSLIVADTVSGDVRSALPELSDPYVALLFNDGALAFDSRDGLRIVHPATGAEHFLPKLHSPYALDETDWVARGDGRYHLFSGMQEIKTVQIPADGEITYRHGRYALIKTQADGAEHASYTLADLRGEYPVSPTLLGREGGLIDAAAFDGKAVGISRRTGADGKPAIWFEAATGQSLPIFSRLPPPTGTDESDISVRTIWAEDGRSALVLVEQHDIDKGWFGSRTTLRKEYRLSYIDSAAGIVAPVANAPKIDGDVLAATADLGLYVVGSDKYIVAVDRQRGQTIARMDNTGGTYQSRMSRNGVLFPAFRSLVVWSWTACLAPEAGGAGKPAWCKSP